MASKSTISFIRSLHHKKFRLIEEAFIVEGPKLLTELLKSKLQILKVFALENWDRDPLLKIPIEIISEKEMEQISTLQTPNKVLAVVQIPQNATLPKVPEDGLHLVVDHIQDPGNLGTIIRIADWFSFDSVICSLDTVELYNPKVVQAAMGSSFRLPISYFSLPDLFVKNAEKAKLPVYASSLTGESLYKTPLKSEGFLVLGNESKGISPILNPFVTQAIRIPGAGKEGGRAESLNVAIATGIICAEFRRLFPLG